MQPAQDQETGRFKTVYHDEDLIDILDDEGPTGTRDVANTLGSTRVHAYNRLRELEEEGRVSSRKIGGSRVWTLAEDKQDGESE